MTRVLLLSTTTGYQLRAFNDAAERRGVEILFATDCCHMLDDPWQDRAIAVRFHDEAGSLRAIRRAVHKRKIGGVLAVGDRPVALAARVAQSLGLPGNPPDAAAASANKRAARAQLAAAGLPAPWTVDIRAGERLRIDDRRVQYPCVVKPLGLSGSRGVIRADSPEQLACAIDRVRALLARKDVRALRSGLEEELLIEGFIAGDEFALEGVLTGGDLRVFAIFDKPDPLDGPFFEETIYVTPSAQSPQVQEAIRQAVQRAATALGLRHGPVHAECRVGPDGVFVLEVAARPIGGLCSRVLRFEPRNNTDGQTLEPRTNTDGHGVEPRTNTDGHGVEPRTNTDGHGLGGHRSDEYWSLEEVLLSHALGEDVSGVMREARAAGVMMIPIPKRGMLKRVEGEQAAREVPDVEDLRITAKRDQLLEPLPESGSYLGFIFARAAEPPAVVAALREAHRRLHFVIDPAIDVV